MKTLYVDMDGVIVDFISAFDKIDTIILQRYADNKDEIPGIFSLMDPMPDAIRSVQFLSRHFDTYILSTAPWKNISASSDKVRWIQKYLPVVGYKRLILSHNKHLNIGDYLIDDRLKNGVTKFRGEHIHFGHGAMKTWAEVIEYLCNKEGISERPT